MTPAPTFSSPAPIGARLRRALSVGLASLLCLTPAVPLGAGQQPSGTAPADSDLGFIDVIDVKVVNLKVYVRDKQGNPVKGLKRDDFELFEDKSPVTITNFYEFEGGSRVGDEDLEVNEEARAPIESNPELRTNAIDNVPIDDRLHLVVYVDHQNIRPNNRNRVFRFLRQFLREHVDRQDRVMLVSYNRSLKVEREFTSDPQLISRALFELEKYTGGRLSVDSDRRDLVNEVQDETRDQQLLVSRARLFAQEAQNDLQFTLDALRETVDNLSGLPGRKSILYVSDGLPMQPGAEMFEAVSERLLRGGQTTPGVRGDNLRMEAFNYDMSPRFRDLANAANAGEVSFYTLDATGLLGRSLRGADMRGGPLSSNMESVWANNMQQSIMFLADETGGQFIVNTNNFDGGFDRFAVDLEHYYSLGFSPSHAGSGRLYNIKVELKDKERGIRVRHRQTYRDKSTEAEMIERVRGSLQYGIQSNDMGVKLVQGERIRRSDGTYMVNVDVRIPLDEVTFLPIGDFHEARLRVWVQARDSDGGTSDPQVSPFTIRVPKDEIDAAKGKFWAYGLPLLMRGGDQWISVGVRDDIGARQAFVNRVLRGEG